MYGSLSGMPDKLALFIAHTPYQVHLAEHMIVQMTRFKNLQRVMAVEFPDEVVPNVSKGLWDEIVRVPWVGGSVIQGRRHWRAATRLIEAVLSDCREAEVLVSDIAWPLNNVLWRKWRGGNTGQNVSLYPDGLMMFAGQRVSPTLFVRNLAKATLGLFGGVPYRPYWGDVGGLDARGIARVYTPLPELTPAPNERLEPIPTLREGLRVSPSPHCVFLGQPIDRFVGPTECGELMNRAARHIAQIGYCHVVYKPHHFESKTTRELAKRLGWSLLADSRPVEALFLERPFACVASFSTSAFVNLKIIYGSSVRCVAVAPDSLMTSIWRGRAQRIKEIFRQFGVETLGESTSR